MKVRERLDAFPTQLAWFLAWLVIGGPLSYIFRNSLPWTQTMSWYAILVTHFGAHIAWRAKRAAQDDTES